MTSAGKKKARTIPLASRDGGTAFWDAEICILIDFLQKVEPNMQLATVRHSEDCEMHFLKIA
jgi:hypothetical protein